MQPLPADKLPEVGVEKLRLIDSHCHLGAAVFDNDRQEVIARAHQSGIEQIVVIGAGQGIDGNYTALQLAEQQRGLHAAIGIHPHDADQWNEETRAKLFEMARTNSVVGYGEVGLDFHYNHSAVKNQRRAFSEQCEIAAQLKLPLIIHTRNAHKETLQVLQHYQKHIQEIGALLHCFSEGPGELQAYLELGMHVSFAGIVTFANATAVHQALQQVPASRLLLETDAPFLTPKPRRGFRNEPACLVWTAAAAAQLRSEDVTKICAETYANSVRFFQLPLP